MTVVTIRLVHFGLLLIIGFVGLKCVFLELFQAGGSLGKQNLTMCVLFRIMLFNLLISPYLGLP
jgi:hypothetical protein